MGEAQTLMRPRLKAQYFFSSLRSDAKKEVSFPLTTEGFFSNPFFYQERPNILRTLDL